MSNIKFSQLPNLATPLANTIVPVVSGGTNYTSTMANITTYVNTNSGAISASSLTASGNVQGAYVKGNGSALTSVAALTAATVTTAAQPNITSVGTLSSLSVTGNVTAGNITTAGTISFASISTSGNISTPGNITGGNLLTSGIVSATANINSGANIIAPTLRATNNLLVTNDPLGESFPPQYGIKSGNIIAGDSSRFGQYNIYSYGFMGCHNELTVSGNIILDSNAAAGKGWMLGNVDGANIRGTTIFGTTISAGGNITAVGNITGGNIKSNAAISTSGNITGGNLIVSSNATISGALTFTGNLSPGNLTVTSNATIGTYLYANLITDNGSGTIKFITASGGAYVSNSGQNFFSPNISGSNVSATTTLNVPFVTKTGTSGGAAGDIAVDANYIYVCTAANTWKRAALTAF